MSKTISFSVVSERALDGKLEAGLVTYVGNGCSRGAGKLGERVQECQVDRFCDHVRQQDLYWHQLQACMYTLNLWLLTSPVAISNESMLRPGSGEDDNIFCGVLMFG